MRKQERIEEKIQTPEIIEFLRNNLKKDEGYLLGTAEYFDDIGVKVFYGITLDHNLNAKFYSYCHTWIGMDSLRKDSYIRSLPVKKFWIIEPIPTNEKMTERLEEIINKPEKWKQDFLGRIPVAPDYHYSY